MIDCLRSFSLVKGRRPPGCPRAGFNDVAVCDCQLRRISKAYKDAQNRLLWRDCVQTHWHTRKVVGKCSLW